MDPMARAHDGRRQRRFSGPDRCREGDGHGQPRELFARNEKPCRGGHRAAARDLVPGSGLSIPTTLDNSGEAADPLDHLRVCARPHRLAGRHSSQRYWNPVELAGLATADGHAGNLHIACGCRPRSPSIPALRDRSHHLPYGHLLDCGGTAGRGVHGHGLCHDPARAGDG